MALGIARLFNSGSSSSRNKEMFSIAAARCTLLGMKVRLPRQRYRRYRRLNGETSNTSSEDATMIACLACRRYESALRRQPSIPAISFVPRQAFDVAASHQSFQTVPA